MEKRFGSSSVFVVFSILVLSISLVSAFSLSDAQDFFDDVFGKITGKAVSDVQRISVESATYDDYEQQPPENAVDDNSNSYYSACSSPGFQYNNGEITFDLEEVKNITEINMDFHRQGDSSDDYPTDGPSSYRVLISENKNSWEEIYSITDYEEDGKVEGVSENTIGLEGEKARYIKISYSKINDGTGWCFGMDEISVSVFESEDSEGDNDSETSETEESEETEESPYVCNEGQRIGDVNGDGNIDTSDANIVNNIYLGNLPSPGTVCCGDVNEDGSLDSSDVQIINYALERSDVPENYYCGVDESEFNPWTDTREEGERGNVVIKLTGNISLSNGDGTPINFRKVNSSEDFSIKHLSGMESNISLPYGLYKVSGGGLRSDYLPTFEFFKLNENSPNASLSLRFVGKSDKSERLDRISPNKIGTVLGKQEFTFTMFGKGFDENTEFLLDGESIEGDAVVEYVSPQIVEITFFNYKFWGLDEENRILSEVIPETKYGFTDEGDFVDIDSLEDESKGKNVIDSGDIEYEFSLGSDSKNKGGFFNYLKGIFDPDKDPDTRFTPVNSSEECDRISLEDAEESGEVREKVDCEGNRYVSYLKRPYYRYLEGESEDGKSRDFCVYLGESREEEKRDCVETVNSQGELEKDAYTSYVEKKKNRYNLHWSAVPCVAVGRTITAASPPGLSNVVSHFTCKGIRSLSGAPEDTRSSLYSWIVWPHDQYYYEKSVQKKTCGGASYTSKFDKEEDVISLSLTVPDSVTGEDEFDVSVDGDSHYFIEEERKKEKFVGYDENGIRYSSCRETHYELEKGEDDNAWREWFGGGFFNAPWANSDLFYEKKDIDREYFKCYQKMDFPSLEEKEEEHKIYVEGHDEEVTLDLDCTISYSFDHEEGDRLSCNSYDMGISRSGDCDPSP